MATKQSFSSKTLLGSPGALIGLRERIVSGETINNSELVPLVKSWSIVQPSMVKRRVEQIWSRSIKNESQDRLLDIAISCCDLTTLEGTDTRGRINRLVAKAISPDGTNGGCPPVAAICVYPDMVPDVYSALNSRIIANGIHGKQARKINIASVASGFPSRRTYSEVGALEISRAISSGANEIDIVIDRGALLSGDFSAIVNDVAAAKKACGEVHLKVILESGELGSLDMIGAASWLAVLGGADFLKTSTGKIPVGATPSSIFILARVAAQASEILERPLGVKASGGIKSSKDALRYLVLMAEEHGEQWLNPERFRFGVSSLLDDLVAQRRHRADGIYFDTDEFPLS